MRPDGGDNQRAHGSPSKRGAAGPEADEEELVVREDGAIAAVAMDDKARADKLARQLERRDTELRQAAEYGLALLEANEELRLQVATLQIRLETETDELAAERDAVRRRHEHAVLELEHWRRRLARAEEDKAALAERLETVRAPEAPAGASAALRRTVAQLQEQVDALEATAAAQRATIASLRGWKAAAEREQEEAHASEAAAARHNLEVVEQLEREQARLLRAVGELEAAAKTRERAEGEAARQAAESRAEAARLGDELAALRVDHSALRESLLTAEARGSRLQRELELLEHVSYFSEAVVDVDTDDEDEDEEDEDEEDEEQGEDAAAAKARAASASRADGSEPARRRERSRSGGLRRRRSSTYSAFPATSVAPDGQHVALTAADVETHTKLHHYFHLTALSIIHENKLHERCFSTSSRFTIDSWYREVAQRDVPFLEWHAWLIDRISRVAASVRDRDADADADAGGRGGNGGGASASTAAAAAAAAERPARVSFAAARAFFRLLWTSSARGDRHSDASSPGRGH